MPPDPVWSNDRVPSQTPPPPSGTPVHLGPYAVVGRWHSEDGGQVLAGRDGRGAEVELVLMAPGPAADPAARDRFAAAVDDLGRTEPGRVLDAQVQGPLAWVALAGGSGPEVARPLLEAPLPAGAGVGTVAGPAFSPHWAQGPQSYPQPVTGTGTPPADERPWWRRWWWLAALVAGVLVLLLLLSSCWPPEQAAPVPVPTPSDGPPATPPAIPSEPPSPGPGDSPGTSPQDRADDAPEQDLRSGPGVAGPGFTSGDETVELRLAGLPFPFRVPLGWECADDGATPPVVRYRCTDTRFPESAERPAPSGLVQVEPCPVPCGDPEWGLLRDGAQDDPGWTLVDVTTAVALDVDPVQPGYQRIRMSRVWSPVGAEVPDTHLFTVFSAPPERFGEVQKITNDIRANTP